MNNIYVHPNSTFLILSIDHKIKIVKIIQFRAIGKFYMFSVFQNVLKIISKILS